MMGSGFGSLRQRLGASVLGIPVVAAVLYLAHHPIMHWVFLAVLCAVTALGMWEFYRLAKHKGHTPLVREGIATAVAYLTARHLGFLYPQMANLSPIILVGALILFFVLRFRHTEDAIVSLSITVFGICYLALPLGLALDLIHIVIPGGFDGRLWLGYLLVVTKMSDVGAYFLGKLLGKRHLARHLSPKKTLEGAAGAILMGMAASWAFMVAAVAAFPDADPMSWTEVTLMGLVLGTMGQIGDLAESVLKRDASVKNSSKLPGLGGVLDILDSLIFAIPTLYFYLLAR